MNLSQIVMIPGLLCTEDLYRALIAAWSRGAVFVFDPTSAASVRAMAEQLVEDAPTRWRGNRNRLLCTSARNNCPAAGSNPVVAADRRADDGDGRDGRPDHAANAPQRNAAAFPAATSEVLDGHGHMLTMEAPEAAGAAIGRFFGQVRSHRPPQLVAGPKL